MLMEMLSCVTFWSNQLQHKRFIYSYTKIFGMGLVECISCAYRFIIRNGKYWNIRLYNVVFICQSVWKRLWRNMRHDLFGYSLCKLLRSIRFLGISTPLSNITLFPKCITSCFKIITRMPFKNISCGEIKSLAMWFLKVFIC